MLFLSSIILSSTLWGQGINFEEITPDEAVAKAKAENKFVFVDVYTDWCGPCRLMDAQIFPLKAIGDYFNPRFVSVKVNAEKGDSGPVFAKKFGIKAYPTFVILDGEGELIHLFAGGVLDLRFIDKVDASFDPAQAFGALKKRYDAGDRDKKLVACYLEALQNTHTTDVTKLVEEFYETLKDEDKIFKEGFFIFDSYAPLGSEKEAFLTENLETFREEIGRQKVDSVLKMKYVIYFSKILQGYDRQATKEKIEEAGNKAASLHLLNADILPVYQAASVAKMTESGQEALFELINTTAPKLVDLDKNLFLYFVIPAFKKTWNETQTAELLQLVTDESTKGYIQRSITPR